MRYRSLGCAIILAGLVSTQLRAQGEITLSDGTPNPAFSNLHAWYQPDAGLNGGGGLPADGTAITRWDDSGASGRDLTRVSSDAAKQPVLRHTTGNGMPAVEFDGNDYIWGNSGASEFGTLDSGRTVFIVARADSADGGYLFDSSTSAARNALFTGENADPGVWTLYTGANPTVTADNVGAGALTMLTVTMTDGAQAIRLNGEDAASGTSALNNLAGLILGARYSVSNHLRGGICELLVYDSELNEIDRGAIETYLGGKYDLEDPPEQPDSVIVFDVSTDPYPNIRIPSLLSLQDGTLLAFAEGRFGGDHAQNDMILKRSTDGGETWGSLQLLDDQGGTSLNDPLAVEVRAGPHDGRVYLFYMSFPQGCHTSCVPVGYGSGSSRNWLMFSDDSGVTWSTPQDITESARPESSNYAGSPGVGIQLRHGEHAGRIIVPLRKGPSGSMQIYMLYSDDGGDIWRRGIAASNGTSGGTGDEVAIAELDDGTILLNARGHNGSPTWRKTARSSDGGLTWTPLENDEGLMTPHCMASIVLFNDTSDGFSTSRLYYAGPFSHSSRSNGSVLISYDGGETWPHVKTVVAGGFAYSQLAVIDACSDVGLLYEAAGYSRIRFMRLGLEYLTDDEETNAKEPPCSTAKCPADLNDDGTINGADLTSLLGTWGPCPDEGPCPADLNLDDLVDGADLASLLGGWGPCPG
jgi:sialidase-1